MAGGGLLGATTAPVCIHLLPQNEWKVLQMTGMRGFPPRQTSNLQQPNFTPGSQGVSKRLHAGPVGNRSPGDAASCA